jgi:hypothetical protein
MFSMPYTNTEAASVNEVINLEETADVIERILHGLYSSRYDPSVLSSPCLRQLHAAVKAHDKFDIQTNQFKATMSFESALKRDPWAGLAFASHINDLALGRDAIKLIRLHKIYEGGAGIWEMMSDIKPNWQIAFARLILPKIHSEFPEYYHVDFADAMTDKESSERNVTFSTKCKINMARVAASFDPK